MICFLRREDNIFFALSIKEDMSFHISVNKESACMQETPVQFSWVMKIPEKEMANLLRISPRESHGAAHKGAWYRPHSVFKKVHCLRH